MSSPPVFGYSTFNNWVIINPPSTPAPSQIDMDITDAVSKVESPYSLVTQMQVWAGAESMVWNVSLPPMKTATALAWVAWMKSLQGIANVFQFGDANHPTPQGVATGIPLVDGTSTSYNLPTSVLLYTKGWTANVTNILLPGDYLQVNYRLYTVLQAVNSDSSGHAVVNIWPSVREQPADGYTILTSNTKGLWRLADNKRAYTEHANKLVGINFKCVEAR